jgi:hypothetical protein
MFDTERLRAEAERRIKEAKACDPRTDKEGKWSGLAIGFGALLVIAADEIDRLTAENAKLAAGVPTS